MKLLERASARRDLIDIWLYSALNSGEDRADETIRRILATLRKTIWRFPASGRLRPELGIGLRSFPILPYIVFYVTGKGHVTLVRILHGGRDMQKPLISLLLAG